MNWKKFALWSAIAAVAVVIVIALVLRESRWRPRTVSLEGAVVRHDADPGRQLPISGVDVSVTDGVVSATTQSDASGYFHLQLGTKMWPGEVLQLSFHHADYKPFSITIPLGLKLATKKLYIAALTPTSIVPPTPPGKKLSAVSNIRIRYTVNAEEEQDIGSAVRTFQVINKGNVPCNQKGPCSPDGDWKAATGSTTLDAGPGNEFRNVRASCIAGPCPFTRIDPSGFEHGGRVITASALDWSDTATFLLEAEVFRKSLNSSVRESYPVIFGRTLNFVLPGSAEGVSIEAEIAGTPMVFPLSPELYLSWATCNARGSRDNSSSKVYRCELKPGYRF